MQAVTADERCDGIGSESVRWDVMCDVIDVAGSPAGVLVSSP